MDRIEEFRRGNRLFVLAYDHDACQWLGAEFPDSFPGVVVYDHAYRDNFVIGDEELVSREESYLDDYDSLAYEVAEVKSEFDQAFSGFLSEAQSRVIDADDYRALDEELTNALQSLRDAVDTLANHAESENFERFRYSPYVDTNGYSVLVDMDVIKSHEWITDVEEYAMSAAKYADMLKHGYVYFLEVYRVVYDEDLADWVEDDLLDSVGGVMFDDSFPSESDIYDMAVMQFGE